MAWRKGTIKLAAAQEIFSEFNIRPLTSPVDNEKVVGYSAVVEGNELKDEGLTSLCKRIVEVLR